ncbi:hypothetical protein [Lysinibacillus sp. NPDC093216]|uniref:hypothetical protein n=1 Tax=Lysinibacillus sp. NPDC093216 TaxID=3390576 RepID=UPI003CFC15F5
MSRFTRAARSRVSGQHDVGHEGVITGRDGFSLRSSIANPRGVAQSPLQSTDSHSMYSLNLNENVSLAKGFVCVKPTEMYNYVTVTSLFYSLWCVIHSVHY